MEKKVLTEAEVREEMKDILPPGAEVIYMSGADKMLEEQGALTIEEFIQRLNNVSKNIKRQCGPQAVCVDNMKKINEIMKSYHGRFVPMFHWDNHAPMKIWYDEHSNSICVDCGVSKTIPNDIENFDENMYNALLNELEKEIIIYYKKKGIDLFGVND